MNDPYVKPSGGDQNLWQELNAPKAWVGESVAQTPEPPDEEKKPFPLAGKVGIVGGLILLFGGVGFAAVTGGDEQAGGGTESAPVTLPMDEDGTDAGGDPGSTVGRVGADGEGESAGNDGSQPSTTDEPAPVEVEPAVIGPDSPPPPPGAPDGNYSVLANGKIYLRGAVPSPEIRDGIVAAVTLVLGEGNVVAEYAIDPSVPFEMGADTPVFVADTVLFAPNSAEIAPDFYPLIGLGVTLMNLQPGVSIEVIGHTDSLGSDESNLTLSQARVDAVKAFIVGQGIDPERLIATGMGETMPVATNETAQGRQANRRVEFIIKGFTF